MVHSVLWLDISLYVRRHRLPSKLSSVDQFTTASWLIMIVKVAATRFKPRKLLKTKTWGILLNRNTYSVHRTLVLQLHTISMFYNTMTRNLAHYPKILGH